MNRTVFLKQSGERLTSESSGELWTPEGVRTSAEKLVRAHRAREALRVSGLVVVSGAGNIIRGNKLREHAIAGEYADVLGRIATVQNTIVLAEALNFRGAPTSVFISPNMIYADPSLEAIQPYSNELAAEALEEGRIVMVAGGIGKDNVTTDTAVVEYAAGYATYVVDKDIDSEVVVMKGTKYDGVYDSDPAKYSNARRYLEIGAPEMAREHERYSAVDLSSLERLIDSRMKMRVYADGRHDLTEVLDPSNHNGLGIGTVITWEETEKQLA